ncbi:TPA: hypothetical protein EYP37_06655 [Candidatus Poribacteria bacterium]|nr:hypothetical protein [Candidatus Poribacteria bacterium]
MQWFSTFMFVILPSFVLLGLGAVLFRLLRKGKGESRSQGPCEKDQAGELATAISILNAKGPVEYCAYLASLVKKHLSEKYEIEARSMSTGEIISKLLHNLSNVDADYAGEILRMCEMVQFYGYKPSRSEIKHLYQLAQKLISSDREEDANAG